MIHVSKFFIFLFLLITSSSLCFAQSSQLSRAEEQRLVSNLNYIQYSIAKIKASENKAIAEDIYYSIINELDLGYMRDNSIQLAYRNFIDGCSNLKLKQNEKDFIKQLNATAQKQAYLNAFSNIGSVFVPGQTPAQMVASLLYTSVANAFAVANTKNQLKNQLEKDMFYLNQDIIRIINEMQSNLFATSMKVLSKTSTTGRINDDSMGLFIKILSLKSMKEKLNSLKETELMKNFQYFPPYWYELGNAYQSLGSKNLAMQCYDKFVALKANDVVEKDSYYVKLLQNRIQIYLGDSPKQVMSNALKNKAHILSAINLLKQNYLDSQSGEKNIYLAKIFYLIGENNQSLECLNHVINGKTLYPEYIEEAIELKSLILCAQKNDMGDFYRTAYNFSKVIFGEDNPISKDFFEATEFSLSNILSSSDNAARFKYNKTNFCTSDYLYFSIPKNLVSDVNHLSAVIDDKFYPISLIEDSKNQSSYLCFIDYEIDDIDDRDDPLAIGLVNPTISNEKETFIIFVIEPFNYNIYNAAEKALSRIGSDILVNNAELVWYYGNLMKDYDYKVDDVQDLYEDIKEDKEDEAEEKNWTKIELNNAISKELNNRLNPDLTHLKERFKKTTEEFYAQDHMFYAPRIVKYSSSYYLAGIISVCNLNDNNMLIYNTDGEFIKTETKDIISNLPANIKAQEEAALKGDLNSMVELGIAYYHGYGITPDYVEAVRWFLKVANYSKKDLTDKEKLAIAKAYKYLGECYYYGRGVKKNTSVSIIWSQKAKDHGIHIDDKFLDDGWF